MKKFALLPFTFLFFFTTYGQNSILWEVSGNGLPSDSYLMGTLKFIGEQEFYMPSEVKTRLKKVKTFAIEDQVDHKAQHELNQALHLSGGETLKKHMNPQDYNALLSLFQTEFYIGKEKFEKEYGKLIPLALSITMTRLSLKEKVKFYDIELLKLAKTYKLETYSLEAIEREAEAIRKFPMEDQLKALVHSVANFQNQKVEYLNLENAFIEGDLEKVFEYTLHPTENNSSFVEEFYAKRNNEWLPKIEKLINQGSSFIAVGVAHLEGDHGLLALLKSKGYTLKPVIIKK